MIVVVGTITINKDGMTVDKFLCRPPYVHKNYTLETLYYAKERIEQAIQEEERRIKALNN